MATGKPLKTNLFIGGWTALAIWQRLRCAGRPRLDQPHTVANLLARAGIKAKSRVPFSGAPSCRDPWETILPAVEGVAGTLRSVSLKMPGIRSIPPGDADGIAAGLPYERPVDLLVDAPSRRRNSSSFHCRVWGRDLPPASFLMLGPHIYLSRPRIRLPPIGGRAPVGRPCASRMRDPRLLRPRPDGFTRFDAVPPVDDGRFVDAILQKHTARDARGRPRGMRCRARRQAVRVDRRDRHGPAAVGPAHQGRLWAPCPTDERPG